MSDAPHRHVRGVGQVATSPPGPSRRTASRSPNPRRVGMRVRKVVSARRKGVDESRAKQLKRTLWGMRRRRSLSECSPSRRNRLEVARSGGRASVLRSRLERGSFSCKVIQQWVQGKPVVGRAAGDGMDALRVHLLHGQFPAESIE